MASQCEMRRADVYDLLQFLTLLAVNINVVVRPASSSSSLIVSFPYGISIYLVNVDMA